LADKVDLRSFDLLEERIAHLREEFPETFGEGKLDFDKLKQALGEHPLSSKERYGLSWAGKAEAIRNVQTRSTGTLVPDRQESEDFDTTENLVLEGDNLEILKLLQSSYHGRIKMIYIDPPYNIERTGNEFIYPDNWREGLDTYLRYSGQVSDNGALLSTDIETSGRRHSKWLSMMYPRLFLARNLLRDDGVIFVSIDDHELQNLRMLMNEIFGQENFIGTFVWQSKSGGGSDSGSVVKDQEYVLCFGKYDSESALARLMIEAEALDKEDDKGPYRRGRELNKWGANSRRQDRPTMFFPIPGPNGEDVYPIRSDGAEGCWRMGKQRMFDIVERGDAEFVKRPDGTYKVYEKIRSTDPRAKPYRTWMTDVGTTADGSKTVKELFDGRQVFSYPKPVKLLKHLIEMVAVDDGDIVLDFFAGSGTTAHAVIELNAEDGGDRRFVCVQLPEPTPPDSEARQAGYETISEITRERIRRAFAKVEADNSGKLPPPRRDEPHDATNTRHGFKAFRLTSSNFKIWDSSPIAEWSTSVTQQIEAFVNNLKPERTHEQILYEILLKAGFPLTVRPEPIKLNGQEVFSVEESKLFVCLEDPVTEELFRKMVERKPEQVVCLDTSFDGNDQLKTNIVLEMRDHDIGFRTV
jgi:adenine-specific DNA-methyltransferase